MGKRAEHGSLSVSDKARLHREGFTEEVIQLIDRHCVGVSFREVHEDDDDSDASEELGTE